MPCREIIDHLADDRLLLRNLFFLFASFLGFPFEWFFILCKCCLSLELFQSPTTCMRVCVSVWFIPRVVFPREVYMLRHDR